MDARGRQSEIKKQDERERGQEKDWQMVLAEAFDTEACLTTVGAGRTIATYKPKSYIFRQGTKCDAVYYLQKGRIELSVVSSEGKERVVGLLGPGSFVCVPPGVVHTFANKSARPVRMLNFNTPGGWEKYMRDLGQAAQSDPLTPEIIGRIASRYDFRAE